MSGPMHSTSPPSASNENIPDSATRPACPSETGNLNATPAGCSWGWAGKGQWPGVPKAHRNSTVNILVRAAYHRSRDLGYTVIIGNGRDASAVSGKLNHVAVDECDHLIVCETEIDGYEIWGCRRTSDGTIAERGSLEYLTDLLTGDGQDPRLVQELRRLKETGSHREFFRNLAAGAVRVVYELVTVDNDGGIRYARFSPNRELLIR